MGFRPSSRTMNNLAWRQMSLFIVRKRTLLQRKFKPSFFWAAVFARGFLGIKCHIFEVLSSSSSQWTSFLFKKCVYQLCFLCFLLFHEAQRGLMVSGERRLAFLLDENVHRYITFGQASIILKFNRKKIKNKQRNRSKYDKFSPITSSCEAGRMFTSKRQMKPAAVMDAQDGTP